MKPFLQPRWRILPAAVAVGLCLQWGGGPARAAVIFDGSVGSGGPGVAPDLAGYDFAVEAARGEQANGNLFHSFSEFSLADGESVGLIGEGDFANVFLRVSSRIELDGTFYSDHAGADVFLLSPQGITLGEHGGFVDMPAGLTLSTADQVLFADGAFPINETSWSAGGCCTGAATALVFAGAGPAADPAPVEIQALAVALPPGTAWDLFKGLRVMAGRIAVGGRELGSSESVIRLTATGTAAVEVSLDPNAQPGWLESLGPEALIELTGAELNARLGLNSIGVPDRVPGGRILLEGGQLRLANQTDLEAGGDASGPAIVLRASDSIELAFTTLLRSADIPEYALPLANGPGIEIEAPRILFEAGPGPDGGLHPTSISSSQAPILIQGDSIGISGSSFARVYGLSPGGGLATDTSDSVSLQVVASNEFRLDRGYLLSLPGSATDAGDIHVVAGSLEILAGGQIRSDVLRDQNGGDIHLDVEGAALLSGLHQNADGTVAHSGLLARAENNPAAPAPATGTAGSIYLRAGQLEVLDGALISGSTQGTAADAGSISVDVEGLLRLSGQEQGLYSEIAVRSGNQGGGAGSIDLHAGRVEILDGTIVTASSHSESPAGDVSIRADQVLRLEGAGVNAESLKASTGGSVVLAAGEQIDLVDSYVRTNVRDGEGSGGNIAIGAGDSPERLVLNGADVEAKARKGDGGNIDISARYMLKSVDSNISAASREGVDGLVSINAPEVEVAGRVEPLPVSYLDVTALLQAHCAARQDAGSSSFTIEGRPGTPPPLDGYRPSTPTPGGPAPGADGAAPAGRGSVRRQLDGFDPGCGRDWRLAVRD